MPPRTVPRRSAGCARSVRLPGLIVLDLCLPVLNGAELLSIVRSYRRLSLIPVLALRGRAE